MIEQPNHQSIDHFKMQLREWYMKHGRKFPWRDAATGVYEKIIAEILLQRTQANSVAVFYLGFIEVYPSWRDLAAATEQELEEFLKPIGLWRRRASAIKHLAIEMAALDGQFPATRKEIENLPGVGQYIANAIMLFYHHQPQPLLDTNMARVLERCFGPRTLADIRHDPYLQAVAALAVDSRDSAVLNWSILDLAALICTRGNPDCDRCPLSDICVYALARRVPESHSTLR